MSTPQKDTTRHHEDWVLQALDKLKAAGELLDTHGTDAAGTAEGLALAAAEILARRATT